MNIKLKALSLTVLSLISTSLWANKDNSSADCLPTGDLNYICEIKSPEDLAVVNDDYLIASGMSPKNGLHLVDIQQKNAERLPFKIAETLRYTDCETAPIIDEFQAHGISLRKVNNNEAWLYVINHGGSEQISDLANGKDRETIEIFSVNTQHNKPALTWQGCVKMPENLVANAVVSDENGTIYTTVALHPNDTAMDFFGNRPTGAIYRWTPTAQKFEKLQGTELVGNNGIEISKDGKHLYVVAMTNVSKFTATQPAKQITTSKIELGLGDNIRWVGDRLVLGASRLENCPATGADFSCMTGYHVSAVDPENLKITPILKGENTAEFSGVSVALPLNNTLWLGSFQGNRLAYKTLE
ncbi:hypothetical protein A1D22_04810 [Pasteurellaceae bacterium LFhippo2]|nr:hypothetical protein [Pasteurellaceae bacterium LFhippo2]